MSVSRSYCAALGSVCCPKEFEQGCEHFLFETMSDAKVALHRLLEQRCQEWCVKMCVATVDFMKAFGTISHKSLWNALEQFGIEPQYTSLLKRLYADKKRQC